MKKILINGLIKKGFAFNKSAFELSRSEIEMFTVLAKQCKYRKPKNSYFSLGCAFYLHLQKIANKQVTNNLILRL